MHSLENAPDDVVAVRFSGWLDRADIDAAFGACRDRLERHESIAACVDLTGLRGITADGLLEDLVQGAQALTWMGRVRRKAVVTDARPYHALVALAGSVMVRPQVRAFGSGAWDAALAWASDRD